MARNRTSIHPYLAEALALYAKDDAVARSALRKRYRWQVKNATGRVAQDRDRDGRTRGRRTSAVLSRHLRTAEELGIVERRGDHIIIRDWPSVHEALVPDHPPNAAATPTATSARRPRLPTGVEPKAGQWLGQRSPERSQQ